MKKTYLNALIALCALALFTTPSIANDPTDKIRAIAEEITEMRSNLAKTFVKDNSTITEETFQNVCGAVGKRVNELTEKEALIIRHVSAKNRNPKNTPTAEEAAFIFTFEGDKSLKRYRDAIEKNGVTYNRFIAPIYIEQACLACHGEKKARPEFIATKYPNDKAYGFKTGDLRGIIIVLAPKAK